MPNDTQPSDTLSDLKFDNILDCVHCGLCLDACPTYRELGLEQDSPRGRLYLMRGLWNKELSLNKETIKPISQCLDCRACETACPSGVSYGELLEKTRAMINQHSDKSMKENLLRFFILKQVFLKTWLLVFISKVLNLYQNLKIPFLITQTNLSKILPSSIVEQHRMMPKFSGTSFKRKYSGIHSNSSNFKTIEVALFSGCILDVANAEIHKATLEVLKAVGCNVHIPSEQTCCGALHMHNGERNTTQACAEKNIEAFKYQNLDSIIVNAAGCGAQLKEYHHLFHQNTKTNEINKFESSIIDIMAFLEKHKDRLISLNYTHTLSSTVLYDAPCHLLHAQSVDKAPQNVIESIPGIQLQPIPESDWCCGSAGIYNLLQPELSGKILKRKIDSVELALKVHPNAEVLLTGNPGCLFQIKYGIEKRGLPIKVMHPIVFLHQSIKTNKDQLKS